MAKRAAVLGWPISHSKSPLLHRFWLEQNDIAGDYFAFPVRPENLKAAIHGLQALEFCGVNITVPHKEQALALCDRVSETARAIGAVNCLVFSENQEIIGDNSDKAGFLEPLVALCFAQNALNTLPATHACVLGAGGAARAVVMGLIELGFAHIKLVCRNPEQGAALQLLGTPGQIVVMDWRALDQALQQAALLVNTTPLGMHGQADLVLDVRALAPGACVYDLVYAPLQTPFLAQAHVLGFKTINGLDMLIGQAARAFELFYKVKPQRNPQAELALRQRLIAC
jgi:shikimate dehydrogenase